MKFKILLSVALIQSAFALNPVSEMGVTILPENTLASKPKLGLGVYSRFNDGSFDIPYSLRFPFGKSGMEGALFGAYSTHGHDYNKRDAENRFGLGFRTQPHKGGLFEVDLNFGYWEGTALQYSVFHNFNEDFKISVKTGWSFYQVTGKEFTIADIAAIPRFSLGPGFDILLQMQYSSSPTSLKDYSALDLAPGVELRLEGGGRIQGLMNIGAYGPQKADPWIHRGDDLYWKLRYEFGF